MEGNAEVIARGVKSWNDGDLRTWLEDWDPDVVVISPEGWPDGEVTQGREAWMRQAERLRDDWSAAHAEIDDLRAVENRVYMRFRYVTTGSDATLPFETSMAAVFFFREGLIAHAQYFWDAGEALRAAGLTK